MIPLILVGGGGHCKSVIDVIESDGSYRIKGILDKPENVGKDILGYSIVGTDDDISVYSNKEYNFLVTVGQIKSAALRQSLFQKIKNAGGKLPVIISSKATVSRHATIEEGSVVHHFSFINAGAVIGKNCIINTGCIIEHDCQIGDNCHISTGAILNGEVVIQSGSFVGSGSVFLHNKSAGNNAVIGAGSLIIKNISANSTILGNPSKAKK